GGSAPWSSRSFSGYARPSGPRWRLRARSKPTFVCKQLKTRCLDEHRTDLIAWQREPAAGTVVPPLGQILGHRLATDAGLAGVAWVHGYRLPAGSFRLADENSNELATRGVANRLGQAVVLNHVLDPEVFVTDHVERHHQVMRGLVLEVAAYACDLLMQTCDTPPLHLPI